MTFVTQSFINYEGIKTYVNKIFYMIFIYMDSNGKTAFNYKGQIQISSLPLIINFFDHNFFAGKFINFR